ncbi:inositol polyphosphate kinase-domain-containing protein [Phyllosticta citrichinensis]|uniref:Kinase n=1 Tax=Phyllosticta citrichinensis TaxID=1130410 RepID=A0ABR1XPA1_9PEZI
MPLDTSTLTAFENAAAGHDGVLSDPTGALVIKPCTPQEIAFYESAAAAHPRFARYMPTFMGTLKLGGEATTTTTTAGSPPTAPAGTAASLQPNDPGPLKGKKLATDTSIVLENAAAGFARPNVLDLKLGARLWDDGTAEAKRARLDKVAAETTSSSLGFRIAGMRVWQGDGVEKKEEEEEKGELASLDPASGYKTFNKLYGRVFAADTVKQGFRDYLLVPSAGVTPAAARETIRRLVADVRGVQAALEAEESRMYSASLLFVYEGDPAAARAASAKLAEKERAELDALQSGTATGTQGWNEDDDDEVEVEVEVDAQGQMRLVGKDGAVVEGGVDDGQDVDVQMDDDDEEEEPKLVTVKLIDFAHARWTPGEGPDENALRGVRAVVILLEELERELETEESQ